MVDRLNVRRSRGPNSLRTSLDGPRFSTASSCMGPARPSFAESPPVDFAAALFPPDDGNMISPSFGNSHSLSEDNHSSLINQQSDAGARLLGAAGAASGLMFGGAVGSSASVSAMSSRSVPSSAGGRGGQLQGARGSAVTGRGQGGQLNQLHHGSSFGIMPPVNPSSHIGTFGGGPSPSSTSMEVDPYPPDQQVRSSVFGGIDITAAERERRSRGGSLQIGGARASTSRSPDVVGQQQFIGPPGGASSSSSSSVGGLNGTTGINGGPEGGSAPLFATRGQLNASPGSGGGGGRSSSVSGGGPGSGHGGHGGAPSNGGNVSLPPLPSSQQLARELETAAQELRARGLYRATQWAAELLVGLDDAAINAEDEHVGVGDGDPMSLCGNEDGPSASVRNGKIHARINIQKTKISAAARRIVTAAKSHFDLRQYMRAHALLCKVPENALGPVGLFLKWYSLYLIGESHKEQESNEADALQRPQVRNRELKKIERHLSGLKRQMLLDAHGLYLLGVVLKGLDRMLEARDAFGESLRLFPWNWSAWLDYLAIVLDHPRVPNSEPEDCWTRLFFRAAACLELQQNDEALTLYHHLQTRFPSSTYILAQIGVVEYNRKDYEESLATFHRMRTLDPHKLESLDTYSNILYVQDNAPALGHLAKQAVRCDKYTPEACCIIGNYFSLKGENEKAVSYFHRALQLNRLFTPAWILMGHEFMEMKNSALAVDAYRSALSINKRDYRAWYGMGQVYELLNLYHYAIYYYREALALRATDARMWNACAGCYESMGQKGVALKCFERAYSHGDSEGLALPRLARLHAEDPDGEDAAATYYQEVLLQGGAEALEAVRYLMGYCMRNDRLEEAAAFARQLLDTGDREEAKNLLKQLEEHQGSSSSGEMVGDDVIHEDGDGVNFEFGE
ncbi:unnamed protein product [Amoebophrya sp. A25]|nr:unnamed protein product [Amoebophrya sp. A25]|eukprot:GSA25T00004088001.1